jgi:Fe2+ or Zn2+ uptake regulation protein
LNVEDWEMDLNLDLSETGLDMFFKPYQVASLDLLWNSNETLSSRQVTEQVNTQISGTISRASIINFLNASVENGLLNYTEITGKGGYRRLYSSKMSKPDTSVFLSEVVRDRLQTL